jgi:hypothetical protein
LLGKMLRIDVDGGPPYSIPPSNPFTATPDFRDEIWALGLRNPWRFSFDRLTGDLWIADVGQANLEEVNVQAWDSRGGQNYGWRRMEGTACFNPATECNDGSLTLPVLQYDHALGCSITAGYRYRGVAHPQLRGAYFYGDFCTGRIWRATPAGTRWTSSVALDSELRISTFGEDERGELYLAHHHATAGAVYRIVAVARKDLRIEGLTATPRSVAAGGTTRVSYRIANRGTAAIVEMYSDRLYLSSNATFGGDTLLATSHGHTVDLAPNTAHSNAQTVRVPPGTPPGNYFILVRADAFAGIAESNESNNVTAISITVTR